TGRLDGGRLVIMMVNAIGMRMPPVNPCNARSTIIVLRSGAQAQHIEKIIKSKAWDKMYTRLERTRDSQGVSGIVIISATRYDVAIHVPSSSVAPSAPWMS